MAPESKNSNSINTSSVLENVQHKLTRTLTVSVNCLLHSGLWRTFISIESKQLNLVKDCHEKACD